MHLGSMRVSKADGSQALDLQRDALLAAGVRPQHLYEDLAWRPASKLSARGMCWSSGSSTA